MLDLFVIFSKGGLVLWCCEVSKDILITSVNALIRTVILQERTGDGSFEHGQMMLQYKLDNEFELVFVAGYQKVLQLSYVDKFLDDMHKEFRDRYKSKMLDKMSIYRGLDLENIYNEVLKATEHWSLANAKKQKQMRTFDESRKSKKTVESMIVRPNEDKPVNNKKAEKKTVVPINEQRQELENNLNENEDETENFAESADNNQMEMGDIIMPSGPSKPRIMRAGKPQSKTQKSPKEKIKEGKKPRIWDNGGSTKDLPSLDRTKDSPGQEQEIVTDYSVVGKMRGQLKSIDFETKVEDKKKEAPQTGRVLNMFKGLVGSKTLTNDDVGPALDKLKDHLISKNVAADVALKLCESVATKLTGKVLGTFQTINSTVKAALEDSLMALLQPKRQVDVYREVLDTKSLGRPFVITFCGVNGVGKSTNLAKICFWLIENNLRVLVAACDTFRAGAVEQLRTHARHLNALHPSNNGHPFVQLYEKGYGKDAAGLASEAIAFARDSNIDVVLVDTAGRMQDNEPLMRALAKLIRVNNPDLVFFVGEALVGNEAVDQLVKFNRALADFSEQVNPRLIDGIVLTKFDTIDDKVGAAVSMSYITGQPIVFVGTGQTYTDLKTLDPKAIVTSLMK